MTFALSRAARALAVFGLLIAALAVASPTAAQNQTGKKLRIATRVVPPLVIRGADGALAGFSIDVWRGIAADRGWAFDLVEKRTLPELLEAVKSGEADAAVAAVSITAEREENFDFSQPLLESGLQILTREHQNAGFTFGGLFSIFSSSDLYKLVGLLLLLTLLPAPIIWLAERRHDDGIIKTESARKGVGQAAWWSITTLIGQAERVPRSFVGRTVALVWMFVGVIFVAWFTATAATTLTIRELETGVRSPDDLPGRKVATVASSTSAQYLREIGAPPIEIAGPAEAIEALTRGQVDAFVYDAPVLQYYASHAGRGKVRLAGAIFRKEDYGVLLPAGSPLRKQINASLLKLRENGAYRSIHANYFGKPE